jgi:MFS family permease
VRADGFAPVVYGGLLSLNGALIIGCELPLTALTRRLPVHVAMALGALLIGVGFGLTAFAATAPLLILSVAVWTLGEMVNSPVAGAYVADIAPPHLRGQYAGAFGLSWSCGLILAPAAGTRLFVWNPRGLWLFCGLLGAVAALLLFVTQRPAGTSPLSGVSLAPTAPRAAAIPIHAPGLRRRRARA